MALSKKEQIMNGALSAFAQYGYSETTMDAIAEVARVAKGTLYYHFKTKEDLFLFVIEKGVEMLIDSVTSVMQDESRSVYERMLCVLDEHLRFFSQHQELCLLLLGVFTGDQQRDQMVGRLLAQYFSTMERYLNDLKEKGLIIQDIDVKTLASGLFGMIGFTMLRKIYRKEELYTEETRTTLQTMCKGALGIKHQSE